MGVLVAVEEFPNGHPLMEFGFHARITITEGPTGPSGLEGSTVTWEVIEQVTFQ